MDHEMRWESLKSVPTELENIEQESAVQDVGKETIGHRL